jgi:hypothetical protein
MPRFAADVMEVPNDTRRLTTTSDQMAALLKAH